MNPFPILQDIQVALVRAQHSTGIILDESNKYVDVEINPNFYLIFNDLEAAREYINSKMEEVFDVEFVVYDKHQDVVLYVAPPGSYYSENPPPFVK